MTALSPEVLRAALAFSLDDAHKEFLPDLFDCQCQLCDEFAWAATDFARYGRAFYSRAAVAYYAAMSERLRALVGGRHVFRSLKEKAEQARAAFRAEHGRDQYPGESIVKVHMHDFYATGMGLGMTPGRYRMHGAS